MTVVIKGLAITAGSKPSFFARIGIMQPIIFAKITVSATALTITRITMSQTGGKSSFFPSFFQSIPLPLNLYSEGTALTVDTLHSDLAVQDIYYPLYQRQTKSGTLSGVGGITLVELFKNMLSHLRLHAAAGIAEDKGDPVFGMADGDVHLGEA